MQEKATLGFFGLIEMPECARSELAVQTIAVHEIRSSIHANSFLFAV